MNATQALVTPKRCEGGSRLFPRMYRNRLGASPESQKRGGLEKGEFLIMHYQSSMFNAEREKNRIVTNND